MPFQDRSSKGDLEKAFSNLRLLTFLFIFFIFFISGTTVLLVATQTKENVISLTHDEIRSKAAIAALQIDGDAVAALRPGDENSPVFLVIRDQLAAIRRSDPTIRYSYTMRRSGSGVEFVVDGEFGISPDAARIGQSYPYHYPELIAGFTAPSADRDFTTDEWGSFLSGYAPVRNSRGEVVGIIGLDMDATGVTERIRYLNGIYYLVGILATLAAIVGILVIERRRSIDEELILANRNYLTRIFESVQAGILIVDETTHEIVDANPSALALIGASKEDVTGRICHAFLCPAEMGKCPVTDLKQTVDNSERILLTFDGRRVPVIKYVQPVILEGRSCLLETFIDITDRKKAEEDLVAAVRKLKVLSVVTRNDIISDIYALAGYLELLRQEVPEISGNPIKDKIDWVIERIRHKSAFFRDYDDAGTREPVWQEVGKVAALAAGQLITTKLTVRIDVAGLSVFADQLLIRVFSSLLDNTLRHGIHATEVRISSRLTPEKNLIITYEDNGVGISPAEKERIFERGIGLSTGLGLFLAKEILAITGIGIRESGESGSGARFELIVPEGRFRSEGK